MGCSYSFSMSKLVYIVMLLRQFLDWLSWIQEIAVLSFFHFEGGFSPHFPEVRSTQAYWEGRLLPF